MSDLHFAGFAPDAIGTKEVLQRKKLVNDDGVDRLLDDKAGDVVGRVDHAVALALAVHAAFADGRAAERELHHIARAGNALQVADALFKNAAQHGHADLLRVVITGQLHEAFDQFVADREAIKRGIGRKQAAVVGRYFQVRVAHVNGFEQADKIGPQRQRVVGVDFSGGALDGALGQQAPTFSKGNKQQAVNQLLRMCHQVIERDARVEVVQAMMSSWRRVL